MARDTSTMPTGFAPGFYVRNWFRNTTRKHRYATLAEAWVAADKLNADVPLCPVANVIEKTPAGETVIHKKVKE